jgi:hypothetical protein
MSGMYKGTDYMTRENMCMGLGKYKDLKYTKNKIRQTYKGTDPRPQY